MHTDNIAIQGSVNFETAVNSRKPWPHEHQSIRREVEEGLTIFLDENLCKEELESLSFKRAAIQTNFIGDSKEYHASIKTEARGGGTYTILSQHNASNQQYADARLKVTKRPSSGHSKGSMLSFDMKRDREGALTKQVIVKPREDGENESQVVFTLEPDGGISIQTTGKSKSVATKEFKAVFTWIDTALLKKSNEYREQVVNELRTVIFTGVWPVRARTLTQAQMARAIP